MQRVIVLLSFWDLFKNTYLHITSTEKEKTLKDQCPKALQTIKLCNSQEVFNQGLCKLVAQSKPDVLLHSLGNYSAHKAHQTFKANLPTPIQTSPVFPSLRPWQLCSWSPSYDITFCSWIRGCWKLPLIKTPGEKQDTRQQDDNNDDKTGFHHSERISSTLCSSPQTLTGTKQVSATGTE